MSETIEGAPARPFVASDAVLVLVSLSIVTGVAGGAIRLFFVEEIFFTIATVIGALAPVSLALAAVVALRDRSRVMSVGAWTIAALVTLGVAAQCVGVDALARSWRQADTLPEISSPELLVVTILAFSLSLVLSAAAVTITVFIVGAPLARGRRIGISLLASIPGSVALFVSTIFPPALSLVGGVIVVVVLSARMAGRTAVAPAVGTQAPRRFRLAVAGSATVAVAWVVAAAIGLSNPGEPIATTAMGWGSAAAQLGAIPLVLSTVVGSLSHSALRWRPAYIAVIGIMISVVVQFLFGNPDGVAVFAGAAIVGVMLGLWMALSLRAALPTHPAAALAVAVGLGVLGVAAWLSLVVLTGGFSIVIIGLVMMLVFRPATRRGRAPDSPPDPPTQPSDFSSFAVSSAESK